MKNNCEWIHVYFDSLKQLIHYRMVDMFILQVSLLLQTITLCKAVVELQQTTVCSCPLQLALVRSNDLVCVGICVAGETPETNLFRALVELFGGTSRQVESALLDVKENAWLTIHCL